MIEEIVEGLFLVPGANRGRFPWSHSILTVGDRVVLFDTGCGTEAIQQIKKRYNVDLVINSHTHPDHFSGNHYFQGCELWVPEMFAGILADLEKMSVRLAGGGKPAQEWLRLVREVLGHVPTPPTGTFRDGDLIDTGNLRFRAVHTPGHTADHFCFFEEDKGILLSFDIDFTRFGPWYGHDECDIDDFCGSLRRVLELKPRMVVSSHRRPITEEIEKEIASFASVFSQRDEKILRLLDAGPATPEKLADHSPIYGVRDSGFALAHYFESRMIEKHLELLERKGLVIHQPDGSYCLSA